MKTVPEALRDLAKIYEERNKVYGNNYKSFGDVMMALVGAIELTTPHDHNRFGVFTQIVSKLTRYAAQWENGGHADSLDDLAVYTMMLQELDAEEREIVAKMQHEAFHGVAGDEIKVGDSVYTKDGITYYPSVIQSAEREFSRSRKKMSNSIEGDEWDQTFKFKFTQQEG